MANRVLAELISITSTSNDKNAIYKALVRIREEVVKDKTGILTFYNAAGIAPIIRLLSKPYEKILEVALSILGNVCTLQICCKQAMSNGIVSPLITILKSIPNPKVQCRVCRLLGNLARQSPICALTKGIGVVLVSILTDSKDAATLSMAVRATRLLWIETMFHRDFIRADGVDKVLKILVEHTMVEAKRPAVQSIVEQCPEEQLRVSFMETHIPVMETVNSHVFDCEILKKVKPVIDDTFRMPTRPDQFGLIVEIVKCLEAITNVPMVSIIRSFNNNPHSASCITFFVRNDSDHRTHALRVLSNLARLSDKRILNDADTMTTVCDLLTASNLAKPLTDLEERYCVNVICCLADDACNRAKIRKSGAFRHLLHLAKTTTSDSLLTKILIGMQHFRYDNLSTDLMIKMGLMNVLIDRLQSSIEDLEEEHFVDALKPLEMDSDKNDDGSDGGEDDADGTAPESKRFKIDIIPLQMPSDPEPASSPTCSLTQSPCSSPSSSYSYSAQSPNNQTYDDMDDYSPVVSDIEDDDSEPRSKPTADTTPNTNNNDLLQKILNEQSTSKDNHDILQKILEEQSTSKCELEDGNNSDQGEDNETDTEPKNLSQGDITEQKKTIQMVLNILCSASYRLKYGDVAVDLCKPDILNTLMQVCRIVYQRGGAAHAWDSHGAPMVLSYIIEYKNFATLLKYDFISQVYEMANPPKDHQYCSHCCDLKFVGEGLLSLLTDLGESGHGEGEMAHYLLKSDEPMHQQVATIIPLIIRDRQKLQRLLIKLGALYTITNLILTKGHALSSQAATGLHALAKSLQIPEPALDRKAVASDTFNVAALDAGYKWTNKDILVKFVGADRDDGNNTVQFSERIIKRTCEVFDRMLCGDFRESQNNEVILKNQSIQGIRYFLDCVRQRALRRPLRTPTVSKQQQQQQQQEPQQISPMRAALEAYDMCQVYLLPELEKDILNMITFILDAQNCLELFTYAMGTHKQELTELAGSFYLTSDNISADERVQVFRQIDESDYGREWNDLVLDTIAYSCMNQRT